MKYKCIICEREFEKFDRPMKRSTGAIKRKNQSITCSKKCSKIYARIRNRINQTGKVYTFDDRDYLVEVNRE